MGRWLSQIRKNSEAIPTKLTELGFVSFVGTTTNHFQDNFNLKVSKKRTPNNEDITQGNRSFVSLTVTPTDYLEKFIRHAVHLGLLLDDKRWLKNICYGVPLPKLQFLLEQYAQYWLAAMKKEPLSHKQQNAGRFAANIFLRESLEPS